MVVDGGRGGARADPARRGNGSVATILGGIADATTIATVGFLDLGNASGRGGRAG